MKHDGVICPRNRRGAIRVDIDDPNEHGTIRLCKHAGVMRAHLACTNDDDPSGGSCHWR
jgi:hypothetical protein